MSKTGDYLIGRIEEIEKSSGYPFDFLQSQYFSILNDLESGALLTDANPFDILAKCANAKAWGDPEAIKQKSAQPKKMYICDPDANKSCNRQGCVLMGGSCFTTPNRDFAGSGADGLPEEATPRKVLEMNTMIIASQKNNANLEKFKSEMEKTHPILIPDARFQMLDSETTKIRKHTHDTLWAVMLGFSACAGIVAIVIMMLIGLLSYARG